VVSAIDDIVSRVRSSASDGDIRAAAESIVVERLQDLDRPARRSELYAEYTFLRHDPDWLENDLGRYEAIVPGAVRAALSHWLKPDRRVVVVVNVDPGAPRSGELRATGPIAP
jgi:predicted Zn-dependent peptidase